MNPAEEIVKFWLQNAGYFYQSSIRLPHNKEIDILVEQIFKSKNINNIPQNQKNLLLSAARSSIIEIKNQDFYEIKPNL